MTVRQFPKDPLERALLADVLAAPADDAPRLVYADRLSERGNPRGELIVVQCTCARLERAGRTESDDYRAAQLRESTLLPTLRRAWEREFGGEWWNGTITRGFFTHIAARPQVLRYRWRLFAAHPLEEIAVECWGDDQRDGVTIGDLAWLARKPTAQRAQRIVLRPSQRVLELDPSLLRAALREVSPDDPTRSWPQVEDPDPRLVPAIRSFSR